MDSVQAETGWPRVRVRLQCQAPSSQGWPCPGGKLTDKSPVLLQPEAPGSQHDHCQPAQAVIVAEAELEVAKLRGRLERPTGRHPVTLESAGGAPGSVSFLPAVRQGPMCRTHTPSFSPPATLQVGTLRSGELKGPARDHTAVKTRAEDSHPDLGNSEAYCESQGLSRGLGESG